MYTAEKGAQVRLDVCRTVLNRIEQSYRTVLKSHKDTTAPGILQYAE